ncbi:hypothetical protein BEN47_18680 [Hymenobacter lapidarius]|uniref:Uncharacterized protein n=1 Tax=Hymenobacter lapidarius TaxID=1908237 RepID=A0A1G1SUC5_9BACT|nr:hypothetical protein [Hymenobacter lapidarius]OGX82213.1 hypothetical protein BEN47_18680 [Hymenobacter lapidarius]
MFRFSLLFLLLAGPASAQDSALATAAPAPPVLTPIARTASDTVRAIHRLYAKRRRVGDILTIGAAGADLALAAVSAANENKGTSSSGGSGYGNLSGNRPLFQLGFGGFAAIYGIVAAPVMGVGIQQLIAYGPRREARTIEAYEATHRLPRKIQRQLRKHLVKGDAAALTR